MSHFADSDGSDATATRQHLRYYLLYGIIHV